MSPRHPDRTSVTCSPPAAASVSTAESWERSWSGPCSTIAPCHSLLQQALTSTCFDPIAGLAVAALMIARVEYQGERIILTKHGRDVAMLVPIERKQKSGKR